MSKRFLIALVLAAAALLGATAQAGLADYVGSYAGSVYSGGDFSDITTVLKLNNAGELFGSYEFEDGEGSTKGVLSQAEVLAEMVLAFAWTDKYGQGSLVVLFAADLSSFVGYYGESYESASDLWTGLRREE